MGDKRSKKATQSEKPNATPEQPKKKQPSQWDGAVGWAKSIAIAFVMWLFLRSLLVEAYHITSGSMENTLLVGDVLFVNKALYGAQLPIIGTQLPAFRSTTRRLGR